MDNDDSFLLAHISDLHFSEGTDKSNPNHAHSIEHLIGLEKRLKGLQSLDCLIVSGDVSNHGDRQSLITASGWLFKTIPIGDGEYAGLELDPRRVRVVPGNHDAWNAPRTGSLIERRQRSLQNYNFAFPDHQISENGCHYTWLQKNNCGLYIAFVDSCFFGDTEDNHESTFGTLRYDQAVAKGKLSVQQTEQLLEWHDKGMQGRLETAPTSGDVINSSLFAQSLKILVMHHYLFEPPEQKSDYFMRVQHRDLVFRNIALSDFDILLCGHKHFASFDVHDYGDHFDQRAMTRYVVNYFRRLIGLESLPIQFVDDQGRRLSRALTWLSEVLGSYLKRRDPSADDTDLADRVLDLLKSGLDSPEELERNTRVFLHELGKFGSSTLEGKELKAIRKRISVGLSLQERKDLRKTADNISGVCKRLRERPFLQIMSGSSGKVLSVTEKRRSFNVYRIQPVNEGWKFISERFTWRDREFTQEAAVRTHVFKSKL